MTSVNRSEAALQDIQYRMGEPLWDLYQNDGSLTEIMLNPDGRVFLESHSKGMYDSGLTISSENALAMINTIASINDLNITRDNPNISATIPGKDARFEGLVPPAVINPTFSIRIPSLQIFGLGDYVASQTMSEQQAQLIAWCVRERMNILVVGSTGSGKTTLTNAILAEMKDLGHRIVIIEDTQELRCEVDNHVALRVIRRTPFDYQAALFSAMRLNPDRIGVGELRDGHAALELLKAWNTGHGGGIATIHANDSNSSLTRVESLLDETGGNTPKQLIAEAVNVVVFIKKLDHGHPSGLKRMVTDVSLLARTLDVDGRYQFRTRTYHPYLMAQWNAAEKRRIEAHRKKAQEGKGL